MTTIKIMTLPQKAMDVAISVAADVLHLWPSLDGYDAMVGVSDVIPDSQIMIQVPEYNKTNPFGNVDKDDKPSQETEERFRKQDGNQWNKLTGPKRLLKIYLMMPKMNYGKR